MHNAPISNLPSCLMSVLSGVVDKHLDHNDNGRAQKPDFGQINLITVSMQAMHISTLNKT